MKVLSLKTNVAYLIVGLYIAVICYGFYTNISATIACLFISSKLILHRKEVFIFILSALPTLIVGALVYSIMKYAGVSDIINVIAYFTVSIYTWLLTIDEEARYPYIKLWCWLRKKSKR